MFALTEKASPARVLSLLAIVAGVFVGVALIAQIADQVSRGAFAPERYFSYFSIQTSIANSVFLIVSGVSGLGGRPKAPWAATTRACLVAYAVMTAVVYELLLREGVESLGPSERLLQWPIDATHLWIPIYLILDWLIRRDRPRLRLSVAMWGAVYPAVWFLFSFGRGALTGWYPYAFMNPTLPGGLPAIALAVASIGALYVVSMAIVLGVNRLHRLRG